MNICELGKIDVILGMSWLTAHNPEIDQEKEKVRIMRCSPLCRKAVKIKEKKEIREEKKKIVRWAVDKKKDQEKKRGNGSGSQKGGENGI